MVRHHNGYDLTSPRPRSYHMVAATGEPFRHNHRAEETVAVRNPSQLAIRMEHRKGENNGSGDSISFSAPAQRTPVLLVHQMARAGSMTTVNSLRQVGSDMIVHQTHCLNHETIEKRKPLTADLLENHHTRNVRVARRVAKDLQREGSNRLFWKLGTVLRKPPRATSPCPFSASTLLSITSKGATAEDR